ncbi:tryptophan 2,3-dioxygenase [Streptomyces sp. Amel2xB2]|uniref:tryptophan 2,3-dioxygenase family protein n=1 Tax=Streptomyces sp. Amel2xB2 TaxID=1305829 RepID=UPI000DBA2D92|nr:tryptophan 2,3-dioxygenase family protein [Streptomyces sp. Amel2xB2]RAJ69913.1 tryptophan 2,3-dioxygenase [Streptomyces sp. Amel2xB2]
MTVTTYATYLHLDELLSLQRPMTPAEEQDLSDSERLFIVVHQASETLLSQVLVDLRHIEAGCCRERCYAYRTERAIRLIDSLDGQLTLLRRTLRREDFLLFRDRFGTASGLQSEQFSELFDLTDRLTAPDGDLAGDLTGDGAERPVRHSRLDALREAVQRWRRTHLELVEHMLGDRTGTGETSGVRFLRDRLESRELESREPDGGRRMTPVGQRTRS